MPKFGLPFLTRVAMLGVATGYRSQMGLAALAATQPEGKATGATRLIGGGRRRASYPIAAAGELVVDKLPKTPSRLQPPALLARIAFGGLAGAIFAQRQQQKSGLAIAVGAAGAAAGSFGGARWRIVASRRFGHDLPGAIIEDVAAISLVTVAVR